MEQSKALSKPDFRHILADINWEHGSHLVLAAKRSDSQGLLLKSVPFEPATLLPPSFCSSSVFERCATQKVQRLGTAESLGSSLAPIFTVFHTSGTWSGPTMTSPCKRGG